MTCPVCALIAAIFVAVVAKICCWPRDVKCKDVIGLFPARTCGGKANANFPRHASPFINCTAPVENPAAMITDGHDDADMVRDVTSPSGCFPEGKSLLLVSDGGDIVLCAVDGSSQAFNVRSLVASPPS